MWVDDPTDSPRFRAMESHIRGIEPMAQSDTDTGYKVRGGFLAGLEQRLPQANWHCVTRSSALWPPSRCSERCATRTSTITRHEGRTQCTRSSGTCLKRFHPQARRGAITYWTVENVCFSRPGSWRLKILRSSTKAALRCPLPQMTRLPRLAQDDKNNTVRHASLNGIGVGVVSTSIQACDS